MHAQVSPRPPTHPQATGGMASPKWPKAIRGASRYCSCFA